MKGMCLTGWLARLCGESLGRNIGQRGERENLLLRRVRGDIDPLRCRCTATNNQLGTRKLLRTHECELSNWDGARRKARRRSAVRIQSE